MALIKSVTLDSGAQVQYWKIGHVAWSPRLDHIYVDLYGYVNKVMRFADKKNLHNIPLKFRENTGIDVEQPLLTQVYNLIKTLPEWADAEDD